MKSFAIACISTKDHAKTIRALKSTLKSLKNKRRVNTVYWFSNEKFPEKIDCNVEWIRINHFQDLQKDLNYVTLKLMPHVIKEEYVLIIQSDGYAVNPESWDDKFLDYDYIGAVWTWHPEGVQVGNGGLCIRSRKLLDALLDLRIHEQPDQEDSLICIVHSQILKDKYGIQFAPRDLADKFSIEYNIESPWMGKSFGFHGKHGIHSYYNAEID